jgi:hypothetical protein
MELSPQSWHNPRMLIPQYSLRSILAVTAACGFVSLIGAAAVRGAPWAQALVTSIAALALILLIHALMFLVMGLFSLLIPKRRFVKAGPSPFSTSATNES